MFDIIVHWLVAVPLGEPWRAIVIVAEVLAFAFALHWLWELSFELAGGLRKVARRSSERSRVGVSASRSDVAVTSNLVRESRPKPAIQAGMVSAKADETA